MSEYVSRCFNWESFPVVYVHPDSTQWTAEAELIWLYNLSETQVRSMGESRKKVVYVDHSRMKAVFIEVSKEDVQVLKVDMVLEKRARRNDD